MGTRAGENTGTRYSEAFKITVVRDVEEHDLPYDEARRKYGIRGCCTVRTWVRQYGNGTRGRSLRVDTVETSDETERLKRRIRYLEAALADSHIELAVERQYTRLACERAGIKDVEEFKKKVPGLPPMGC